MIKEKETGREKKKKKTIILKFFFLFFMSIYTQAIENLPLLNENASLELAEYCMQQGLIEKRQELYQVNEVNKDDANDIIITFIIIVENG